jgi:ring-1,2-phenylacetyl-CoA epoxidase subunit PaaD
MVSAREVAAEVPDPELPMLTLADLGILREVVDDGTSVTVTITPTYSGCPALREISRDLVHRLSQAGYPTVRVRTSLAPAWTSDWITAEGRAKLTAAGLAPPRPAATGPVTLTLTPHTPSVACPRCGSRDTWLTAAFGATACTALYRCAACAEPFEYVKDI